MTSDAQEMVPGRRRADRMMVLGADMHKQSHTIAAIAAATGELGGDKTLRK